MKTIAKVVSIDGSFAVAEKAGSGYLIGAARFDDEANAEALALSINAELYEICPACSGPRVKNPATARHDDELWNCASCGAIFGRVQSWAEYVRMLPRMSSADSRRYFDFSRHFSGERFHGWTDERGRVTQVG